MAALIDENTQFQGVDGKPIVDGYIYIGTKGLDPKLNAITIYSDRELTTTLANPQRTDSYGRPANKIWIPGQYSLKVEDVDNVQQLQDLDAGTEVSGGTTSLTNVQGINAITAEADPAITAYTDKEIYLFTVASTNTGAVTLDAGGGAIAVNNGYGEPIAAGGLLAGSICQVIYNAGTTTFQIVAPVQRREWLSTVTYAAKDSVYGSDGLLYISLTSSNLNNDPTTSTANWMLHSRVVQVAHTQTGAVATGTTLIAFDDTVPNITQGNEFLTLAITPTSSANTLVIEGVLYCSSSVINNLMLALYQDATSAALAVASQGQSTAGILVALPFRYSMTAGTTSSTTFRCRVGGNAAGTITFNGTAGARKHGGVIASHMTITEILA